MRSRMGPGFNPADVNATSMWGRASALQTCVGLAQARVETLAAARLVRALSTEQHALAVRHQALRVIRRVTAHHADRERLGDVLSDGKQLGHRLERLAPGNLIEPLHHPA